MSTVHKIEVETGGELVPKSSTTVSNLTPVTDSGTITIVDAKEHIEPTQDAPSSVKLNHVAKIFTVSGRFSEVNQEQIERVRMSKYRVSVYSINLISFDSVVGCRLRKSLFKKFDHILL